MQWGPMASRVMVAHRRRDIVRFTVLDLVERVAPGRSGWSRHLPTTVLLAAFGALSIGLAGPTAEAKVPRDRATVMLVMDVSLSMKARDVAPSRLLAAQAPARTFVRDLPASINLGLVVFARNAAVRAPPTTDRDRVLREIDTLELSESTATGEAIFSALLALETFISSRPAAVGPPPAHILLLSAAAARRRDAPAPARQGSGSGASAPRLGSGG